MVFGRRRTDANIQPRGPPEIGSVTYRCTLGNGGATTKVWRLIHRTRAERKAPHGLPDSGQGLKHLGIVAGKTAFLFHQISGTVLEDCDSSTGMPATEDPFRCNRRPAQGHDILATTTTDPRQLSLRLAGRRHVRRLLSQSPIELCPRRDPGSGGTSQTRINGTDIQKWHSRARRRLRSYRPGIIS